MQSRRRLLNWLIFVATTTLIIVVADMALVTQEGWIISAQGFAPLTIRNYHKKLP
jgi:ABC-type transport system involved in cytochrome bd biosynthesis fused ATPase/permease subunit